MGATRITGVQVLDSSIQIADLSATGTPSSSTFLRGDNVWSAPAIGGITGLGTGIATFLATPSSANLLAAVTDETGTGALVFATSPTLTTPVATTLGVGMTIQPVHPFEVAPLHSSGTASQSSGTITGTGFTVDMIGKYIVFANGTRRTITGYTNSTTLTASPTGTVTSQAYNMYSQAMRADANGNVTFGSATLPTGARAFLLGGANGANFDIRAVTGGADQAILELQNADFDSFLQSTYLFNGGNSATGTTFGFTNVNLGALVFQEKSNAIIGCTSANPLIFASNNAEKMRMSSTGDLTLSGSLGLTAQRVSKGWFADLEITNGPTIGGTAATGSGGLVRATSPTLVTPVLGTPTSVTLTNATGLPIATGLSGLGAANRIPYSTSATALVTSSNFTYDGTTFAVAGDSAIGHSSPSARVHIIKTTEQLRVGYDTSNYYKTTVSSSGAVTWDAVGAGASFNFSDAVGINGPTIGSGSSLVVSGDVALGTSGTTGALFFSSTYSYASGDYIKQNGAGRLDIGTGGTANPLIAISAGKIGINVVPTVPLHVDKTSTSSINEIGVIISRSGGATSGSRGIGLAFQDANNVSLIAGISGFREDAASTYNGSLIFFANNSGGSPSTTFANMGEKMRLTSTGYLGIGISTPDSGMHASIAKSWTTAGWGKVATLGASGSAPALQFGYGSGTRWGIGNTGGTMYFFTTTADDASAAPNYVANWTGSQLNFSVYSVFTGMVSARVLPRVFGTSSTATLTPEIDTYDAFNISNQAVNLTIANHAGATPSNFETMKIRIKDNGTARTITFGTEYASTATATLPTTTVISTMMEMLFEWNASTSKWMLMSII